MIKKTSPKKILVVDDEPDFLALIRDFLEIRGYKVILALRASEALDLFMTENPDIVITDLLMPEKWGDDLVKDIRKYNETIPIMVMSIIYGMNNVIIEEPPNYYISKPFSMENLLKFLKRVLDGKKISCER